MVFSCSVVMINGQIYHPIYEVGMIAKNSACSRVKVWVAPPGKSPRTTEVLIELAEYVAEEIKGGISVTALRSTSASRAVVCPTTPTLIISQERIAIRILGKLFTYEVNLP